MQGSGAFLEFLASVGRGSAPAHAAASDARVVYKHPGSGTLGSRSENTAGLLTPPVVGVECDR